jgi:undecaprenyl pyrophosphate phosphatase UppP
LYVAVSAEGDKKNQPVPKSFKERYLTQITFVIEIILTMIITIVIGYISKNVLQKKLNE